MELLVTFPVMHVNVNVLALFPDRTSFFLLPFSHEDFTPEKWDNLGAGLDNS